MRSKKPGNYAAAGTVIPVIEEVPAVGNRTVETGRLRIDKRVTEHEVVFDEPLLRQDVRVERVAIGRDISAGEQLPAARYEGETLIIPVFQEVPVLVTKIVLTEEIRITRFSTEYRDPQTVKLKVEEVSVEHMDDASTGKPTRDGSDPKRD